MRHAQYHLPVYSRERKTRLSSSFLSLPTKLKVNVLIDKTVINTPQADFCLPIIISNPTNPLFQMFKAAQFVSPINSYTRAALQNIRIVALGTYFGVVKGEHLRRGREAKDVESPCLASDPNNRPSIEVVLRCQKPPQICRSHPYGNDHLQGNHPSGKYTVGPYPHFHPMLRRSWKSQETHGMGSAADSSRVRCGRSYRFRSLKCHLTLG